MLQDVRDDGSADRRPDQHESQTKSPGFFGFSIIFSFTRASHLFALVPAFLFAALSGLILPVMSILIGRFLNSFSRYAVGALDHDKYMKETLPTIYALVAVGVYTWLVKGGFCCAWIMYGESQAQAVREDVFSALLVRDLAWFEAQQAGVGTLLSRIHAQIHDFQQGVSQPLGLAATLVSQSIASLGVAFYYSWKLTLVVLATFPVIASALSFLSRGLQQSIQLQQEGLTRATKQAQNAISNVTVLKCHNTQASEAKTYSENLKNVSQHFRKQARIVATQTGFMRFVAAGLPVLALFFGNHLIHKSGASPGAVLTTFWCCVTASKSFSDILTQILVLEKGRAAVVALRGLLQQVGRGKKLSDRHYGHTPFNLEGDVELRKVGFAYPAQQDRKILEDTNLFFPAHETTFVVGKSGSGKSTLSTLLLKFYAPSRGKVMIDGTDVRKLDTSWLRNNVTLVQQDSVLFAGSISDNIKLCNKDSSRGATIQLSECITFSGLEDTLRSLPRGIDTVVGKGGTNLSGGQRQRIALARARLRDTPVLILDESTSALDETGKTRVMHNIREWRTDKTTIIITHDLSQIRFGDFMYVLKDGSVVAEGYRSTVNAKLEDIQHLDMIGSSLTPLRPDTAQTTLVRDRSVYCLRHLPVRAHSDASVSSLGSTASQNMTASDSNLLPTYDVGVDSSAKLRKSVGTFLRSQTPLGSAQHMRLKSNLPDVELDLEYEMSRMTKARELHNRLTMTQAIRPHTIHPTFMLRPKPQPVNVESPLQARPITIWSDIAGAVTRNGTPAIAGMIQDNHKTCSLRQILVTAWPALSPADRPWLAVAVAAAAAYAAVPSISAWITMHLFQTFRQQEGWVEEARHWSLMMIALGCADSGAAFTIHYLFESLAQAWITALRLDAFKQILIQPKSWFDSEEYTNTGMCNILDTAAEEVRSLLARFVCFALIAIVMVLVSVIWSLATCWKLTLLALACAPAIYAVSKLLDTVSTRWESRSIKAAEIASDIFAESFSDVRTVRALTLESHFHKKYIKAVSQAFTTGQYRAIFVGFCFGLSDSSLPFVTACIFYYSMNLAKSGEYTTQSVLTVLSLLVFSLTSASSILGSIPQMSASADAGNRILRLVTLPSNSHESKVGLKLEQDSFSGDIEFTQLRFDYPSRPDATILKGLNLTIRAGQHIAVVGRSGCGKSTIISLILGLYQISHGKLKISSHDIHSLDLPSLRSLIGYVSQQPVLLPTTIRQNILYGLDTHKADEELVHSAARSAGIHDFIVSLPLGYNTVIGDGGTGLSGGQAQRIVLARVFARRPRILLMDEPTSALDAESAGIIRSSIQNLRDGAADSPTVVVVTHARDMMEIADKVVVLEDGAVVEEGRYDLLMSRREKLWHLLNIESD